MACLGYYYWVRKGSELLVRCNPLDTPWGGVTMSKKPAMISKAHVPCHCMNTALLKRQNPRESKQNGWRPGATGLAGEATVLRLDGAAVSGTRTLAQMERDHTLYRCPAPQPGTT